MLSTGRQFILLVFPLVLFFATLFSYHFDNYPSKGDIYTLNSATDSYVYQINKSHGKNLSSLIFVDTRDYKGSILPLAGLPLRLLFPEEIDSNRVFVSLMYILLFVSLTRLFAGNLGRPSSVLLAITFFSNGLFLQLIDHFDSYLVFLTSFCLLMALLEQLPCEVSMTRNWPKQIALALCTFICFTTRPLESTIIFISGLFFLKTKKLKHSILLGTFFSLVWWLVQYEKFLSWWQGSITIKSGYELDVAQFVNILSIAMLCALISIFFLVWSKKWKLSGDFKFYLLAAFGMTIFFISLGMLHNDYFIIPLMLLFIGIVKETLAQKRNRPMTLIFILVGAGYFTNFFSVTFFKNPVFPLDHEMRSRHTSASFVLLREEIKRILLPDRSVEIYNSFSDENFNPLVSARKFMNYLKTDYELRKKFIWVDSFREPEHQKVVKQIVELCAEKFTYIFRFSNSHSPLTTEIDGYEPHMLKFLGKVKHIADKKSLAQTPNQQDFDLTIFAINCPPH